MSPTDRKRRRPSRSTRRSIFWRWRRGFFLSGLLVVAGIAGAGFVLSRVELPPETPLRQTTFICSSAVAAGCGPDNAIASLSAEQDRVNVTLDEVPDVMVQAVIAAEDQDFFSHQGIDPIGIARAAVSDIRGSASKQGGSTITQQYVKNVYLTSERTITRKLKEAVLAVKLERELDKTEILERYLNTIYFGRGAYGVQAASRAYFGRDVGDLELSQAAYLAGLIRAPEAADASRDPEAASFRRASVLTAMFEEGYIDRAAFDAADSMPWTEETIRPRTVREGLGPVEGAEYGTEYFVEYVRQLLTEEYGEDVVYGGGLRVYTSLDLAMQQDAWQAIDDTLDPEADDPEAAIVAIDDQGHIKALVGGHDFSASEVNLALGLDGGGSGRQPGSAFKPLVFAQALREGISIRSKFESPGTMVFPDANAGEDWEVDNYGNSSYGVIDLVEATRVSSNTAYAQLMLEVGPADVVELAARMGISAELPAVNSLVLGSGEVSVLDMAAAYSTFANRGLAKDPTPILRVEQVEEDGSISVLENVIPEEERVLSTEEADTVNHVLQQVVREGTGTGANFGRAAAGKTGTTQDNRDAWFVGYTPRLTAAVWMGYPGEPGQPTRFMDSVRGRAVTGGSFPATIWRSFMANALDGVDSGTFAPLPDLGGEVLNERLSTTTTDPCDDPEYTIGTLEDGEPDPDDPCAPTTTSSSTSTSSSSTSTTSTSSSSSTSTSTTTTTGSTSTTTSSSSTSTTLVN